MSDNWYTEPPEASLAELETSRDGLSAADAHRRLAEYGENEVTDIGGRTPVDIFLTQFDSVLIWVLLVAAGLSLWAGHAVDAVLIGIIVVANGIFGFLQDYRAEQSLEALRELSAPNATVRREGTEVEIDATELVPGDILVVHSGDVVTADARLIEASDLAIDEAPLTGESTPVSKSADAVSTDTPLADRACMVYKGTNVTRGQGEAVVTATGMETEVGGIAEALAATETTETPLQRELDRLGRRLGLGVLVLAGLVIPLLFLRGTPPLQAGLTAVSLAVAAVPEGLPAVMTLTLALGVRLMAEENALVRRLPAVEALGAVDVICTDKTGTLTAGQMSVQQIWVYDTVIDVSETEPPGSDTRVHRLIRAGALANDASRDSGDPTERALVRVAEDHGVDVAELREMNPRTDEIPFSSERKWMGTSHGDIGYVKGAPTVVLENATRILTPDGPIELTPDMVEHIQDRVGDFADDALRVLALAYTDEPDDLADGLVVLGLVGMLDPARAEVADALAATKRAGIRVKMVTGDNARTAAAIADSLEMGQEILDGQELDQLTDEQLRARVESVDVFARTTPDHKVRILQALQETGHIVAMTGDGVNDAPALKNADIGVAMGERGTDVAKQASDIVLLDDNYATIERAVERGRMIFDNVWKFVAYLLSANIAEVAIVFIASLFGYLVLPAVQLLWINLLTDGLPALALGTDPKASDVMDRPPRDPGQGIIDRRMLAFIGGAGTVTSLVMLALMAGTLNGARAITPYVMTMVFTGFVVLEFEKLYVIRWFRDTPTFSNRWLAASIAASLGLQLAVLYTPLRHYFGTVPLDIVDWGILGAVLLVALPGYLVIGLVAKHTAPT